MNSNKIISHIAAAACFLFFAVACASASDEFRVYRNTEFGMEALVPNEAVMCEALSGGHPRGFLAWFGTEETECEALSRDPTASAVGLYASYNTAFRSLSETLSDYCNDETVDSIPVEEFYIRGVETMSCAYRRRNDRIIIVVVAQAGSWGGSAPPTSYVNYRAALLTHSETLASDVAMFRRFLNGVKVWAPADVH